MPEKENAFDKEREILLRVNSVLRPVEETWETLPEPEQVAWASFLLNYCKKVVGLTESQFIEFRLGGAFAQLWALAHEYYRVFGPLWPEK